MNSSRRLPAVVSEARPRSNGAAVKPDPRVHLPAVERVRVNEKTRYRGDARNFARISLGQAVALHLDLLTETDAAEVANVAAVACLLVHAHALTVHDQEDALPVLGVAVELLGAMITALMLAGLVSVHVEADARVAVAAFLVGLAWARLIQILRNKITAIVEAVLTDRE